MPKKNNPGPAEPAEAVVSNPTATTSLTRYEKVKAILDAAAGDSTADYHGWGRFWNLPYEDFLQVEVYGIRMIAEVPRPDLVGQTVDSPEAGTAHLCCPTPAGETLDGLAVVRAGRGAASGLIKGLRGEYPFNQDYFKPLPWGGTRVSPTDVDFISDWIDDGCPTDDSLLEAFVKGPVLVKEFKGSTNIFKREHHQLKVRKCIDNLNQAEETALRNAVWHLVQLNAHPRDKRNMLSWGRLHGDECQHGWEMFLTWHRMYLYSFEQALQDVDPDVTLPYWDWTDDRYLGGQIPSLLKPGDRGYDPDGIAGITPWPLRCWITRGAAQRLYDAHLITLQQKENLEAIAGKRFNASLELFNAAKISDQPVRDAIYPELARINPLWYQFRYPGMFYKPTSGGEARYEQQPLGVQRLQHYNHHFPTREDVDRLLAIDNWRDFGGGPMYNQSFGILDMDPHNTIHLWSGGTNPNSKALSCNQNNSSLSHDPNEPPLGDMFNNLTAAFDFIFWPHHTNIDRLFDRWQRKFPNQVPDDLDAALPGLGFSVRDALSTGRLGYEYARDVHIFPTGRSIPLGKFQSEAFAFTENIKKGYRKVELRLHQVEQPQYSYALRVFINQPEANLDTPTEGNPHYAGYASFFGHGRCIGGPGHCDPPPNDRRAYDLRVRHHNAPGNIHLDITEAVEKLKNDADSMTITLVLMGPEASDAAPSLRMDGLSINFID